jgi:hypothetical protein
VALTPFHDVPRRIFFRRIALPGAGLLVFLLMCVGIVANSPAFQEPNKGPSSVVPFWEASWMHYQIVGASLGKIPQVCWSGNAVNDFQKSQCEEFWSNFLKLAGLAVAPFAFVWLFVFFGIDRISKTYQKAQKKAEKGKAVFGGVVTNPPDAPADLFSWFYCFRTVTVQLSDKTQVTVYAALETPAPLPGETLVAFDVGTVFGERRHVAMLYAPHVAIVRGE